MNRGLRNFGFLIAYFEIATISVSILNPSPNLLAKESEDQSQEEVNAANDPFWFADKLEITPEYTHIKTGGWSYSQEQRLTLPYWLWSLYSLFRLKAPFEYEDTPLQNFHRWEPPNFQ